MQLFLIMISMPTLAVAILIRERREVENSLRESQENFKQTHERGQLLAQKLVNSQEEERRSARDLRRYRSTARTIDVELDRLQQGSPSCPLRLAADWANCEQTADLATDTQSLSHELYCQSWILGVAAHERLL
jgi:hypothetical protein